MKHIKATVLLLFMLAPFVLALAGEATTYEWIDDVGVIHFTDDPKNVPDKFLKRVKVLDLDSGEGAKSPAKAPEVTAPPSTSSAGLYGGHGERYWRTSFASLRADIKKLEDDLVAKKEKLNQLRRNKIIYQRPGDRLAYNNLDQEIGKDETRIKELQVKLKALDADADNAGVPSELR